MNYELTLFQHFQPNRKTETTIKAIATIWHCSTRHAKTQLHRLHEQQIILWETFQGRGKKPLLTILVQEMDVLLDAMETLWQKSKFEEAIQLAKEMGRLNHPNVQHWLTIRFGIQHEKNRHVFRQSMYFVELCLDPHQALSRHDIHVLEQIHETLFIIDNAGRVQPNLLFHFSTQDAITWHFLLRKGIQFHHLQEVTVTDVKATLLAGAFIYKHSFEIESIEVIDRYELVVKLKNPCALFPYFLASTRLAIVPEDGQKNIGCGPFMLLEQNENQLTLQAFQHYFKSRPWIDCVEIVYNREFQMDAIRYEPFEPTIPSRKIEFEEPGACYICFNSRYGPFVDEQLRAYIWHAIEPSDFILAEENEKVAYSWHLEGEGIILPEPEQKPKLPEMLVIGYQQIRQGVNHEEKAKILQQQLSEMGINVKLTCINFKEQQNKVNETIDLFIGGIALGQNLILSLLQSYLAEPKIILNFLTSSAEMHVKQLLQTVVQKNADPMIFHEIEHFIQQTYTVKFITQRKHTYYVREDTPYKHVQIDKHGRIDYRNLFYSNE